MTERTVARQSRQVPLDDDSVSITSSQSEQYSSGQEFLVERILAEKTLNGSVYYLMLWSEHPEEKATWEPKRNIQDPAILDVWRNRKERESQGLDEPFNLSKFDAKVKKMQRAKAERRRRRKLKRKRIGIPVSSSEPDSDDTESSKEAVEVHEFPDDDFGINMGSKFSSGKPKKLFEKVLRPRGQTSQFSLDKPLAQQHEHQQRESLVKVPAQLGQRQDPQDSSDQTLRVKTARTAGRGRVATRGGSSLTQKNVFEPRIPQRKRPSLLENAADPTKKKKIFSNWHMVRKAELAGREVADAAPDISNLPGGLFDPSNPSSLQPLRPATLRRNSTAIVTMQDPDIEREYIDMENSTETASSRRTSLATDSRKEPPSHEAIQTKDWDPHHMICYYWATKGICTPNANGSCRYLHFDPGNVPVAPAPLDRADRKKKTCKFWIRGSCYETAEKCQYLHGNPTTMASDTVWSGEQQVPASMGSSANTLRRNKSVTFAIDNHPVPVVEEPESLFTTSAEMAPKDENRNSTYKGGPERRLQPCPYWAKGDCYHGARCWYSHGNPPTSTSTHNKESEYHNQSLRSPTNALNSRRQSKGHVTEITTTMDQPLRQNLSRKSSLSNDWSNALPRVEHVTMTLDDYGREESFKATLGSTRKEVSFGSDGTQSTVVDFGEIEKGLQHPWRHSFASLFKLHFDQMCNAQDFELHHDALQRQVFWQGSLASDPTDSKGLKVIDKVAEQLRLCSAGLIYVGTGFVVLAYPARHEEWKFLEGPVNFSADIRLRYLIFESGVDIKPFEKQSAVEVASTIANGPGSYRARLVNNLHSIQFKTLLPHFKKGQEPYNFYFMFPSMTNATANLLMAWLQSVHRQCKIYSSLTEGSWDFFVNKANIDVGVVLIHESAVASICELPSLQQLFGRNKVFTFWCISDSSSPYPLFPSSTIPDYSNLGQITATRLFPHGHALLLTPSFLIAEPERTYELLRWFQKKFGTATPGTWKIICCYNLREYLFDLALEKACERDEFYAIHHDKPAKDAMASSKGLSYQHCEFRFWSHRLVVEMLPKEVPVGYPEDYYSDVSDEITSPFIYADQYIDPDNEQLLVNWFAGWSISKLDQFRKFTVVGTGPPHCNRATRMKRVSNREIVNSQEPLKSTISQPGLQKAGGTGNSLKDSSVVLDTYLEQNLFANLKIVSVTSLQPLSSSSLPQNPRIEARAVAGENPEDSSNALVLPAAIPLQCEDIDMDTGNVGGANDRLTKSLGIVERLPSNGLNFAAEDGGGTEDSRQLLAKSNDNGPKAAQTFGSHNRGMNRPSPFPTSTEGSNLQREHDAMEIDGQIPEGIATTVEGDQHQPLASPRGEQTTERYSNSAPVLPAERFGGSYAPHPNEANEKPLFVVQDERADGLLYQGQYRGSMDRRLSSGTDSSLNSRSSVRHADGGYRVTPGAVRRSRSVKRENEILPTNTPAKDRKTTINRRVDGLPQHKGRSRDSSRRGSTTATMNSDSADFATEPTEPMEVDNMAYGLRSSLRDGYHTGGGEIDLKRTQLEATTAWYARLTAAGEGWEHICVDSWDKCFVNLDDVWRFGGTTS